MLVVVQAADDDGSKRRVTAPVNGAAVDGQAGISPPSLTERSCPEKIETVNRH